MQKMHFFKVCLQFCLVYNSFESYISESTHFIDYAYIMRDTIQEALSSFYYLWCISDNDIKTLHIRYQINTEKCLAYEYLWTLRILRDYFFVKTYTYIFTLTYWHSYLSRLVHCCSLKYKYSESKAEINILQYWCMYRVTWMT